MFIFLRNYLFCWVPIIHLSNKYLLYIYYVPKLCANNGLLSPKTIWMNIIFKALKY